MPATQWDWGMGGDGCAVEACKHSANALCPCLCLPLLPVLYSQPAEIYVDDESKLTLHGLVQHYVMLHEEEKNRKLTDLLDALDFNQVRPAVALQKSQQQPQCCQGFWPMSASGSVVWRSEC
jgi:hypothetical protein